MQTTIVLFHQNLRLADNRALAFAAARGSVVPVYILEDAKELLPKPGGASRWWLRESLKDLASNLYRLGTELILRRGDALSVLRDLMKETGATALTWNRRYEPALAAYDEKLRATFHRQGVDVDIHEGFLLFDPASIRTKSGTAFKVFTPFSKACLSAPPPSRPLTAPQQIEGVKGIDSDSLDDWKLVPSTAEWPKGLAAAWDVRETAAHKLLRDFIKTSISDYKDNRNYPAIDGTSRLSPYLHFGQISPHQIWHSVQSVAAGGTNFSSAERYLLEILWREFSWYLLHEFPALPEKPIVASFENFPWRDNAVGLKAWQEGMTGYPIVDAGMRQLWQIGWMHNRVRMIVASFLIKHLLIDWRKGAAWFWDTLVDADLGSNSASWQWVAGCGADAAPFFRIFNPTLQGQKFDPNGDYVKRYVPELNKLSAEYIHEPWRAPVDRLKEADVKLGATYPRPIVDHDAARKRALSALSRLKDPRATNTDTMDLFD
jgi:deoxyribodipyrimidine photo-lyase